MAYRSPIRPLYWVVALGVVTLVWLAGPYLFPRTHLLVLSAVFVVIFLVWLLDAGVQAVRRRTSARKLMR